MVRESESTSPATVPKNALKQNPASAPWAVVRVELAKSAPSPLIARKTADGGGTKKAGTASARTAISHAASTPSSVSNGGPIKLRTRIAPVLLEGRVENRGLLGERQLGANRSAALGGDLDLAIEDHA